MKYPEYIFTEESIKTYTFTFDEPTTINDKKVYVVDFRPKNHIFNLNYTGKLYIDAKSIALVSAKYALDLSDKKAAKNAFVKRKPRDIEVFPMLAEYQVDYKPKNGIWYYSYSTLDLKFKIKKKRKLFNKVYSLSSEMAVTDWEVYDGEKINEGVRLKPTVIITDAITGFSDPDFWGANNVIEPDKSIESAIRKIKRNY